MSRGFRHLFFAQNTGSNMNTDNSFNKIALFREKYSIDKFKIRVTRSPCLSGHAISAPQLWYVTLFGLIVPLKPVRGLVFNESGAIEKSSKSVLAYIHDGLSSFYFVLKTGDENLVTLSL